MKKYLILVIFSLLMILVCKIFYDNNSSNKTDVSTSMKEAYRIANEAVLKVNQHALLYIITSTDSIKYPEDIKAGKNGKRRYWNFVFSVPNSTTDHWIVFIRDKKIEELIKVKATSMNKSDLIDNMDTLINSNEALEIAIDKYKLKPGEGWAIGYHFKLDKIAETVIIHVFGRDISNNFTKISINAKTKEVIDAVHKVSCDGVTYKWEILNESF